MASTEELQQIAMQREYGFTYPHVFGLIDAQRGFMPASEGERIQLEGFGELPVAGGEEIIEPVNKLLRAFGEYGMASFTTQDFHPKETAHFDENPNFTTTWPVHCVGGTPGAELHPDINTSYAWPFIGAMKFVKGFEPLTRGEDDTSYSGFYAVDAQHNRWLPSWLKRSKVEHVTLGGLALDYCVGKTALDLRQKMGIKVTVAAEATRGIADESVKKMLEAFAANDIRFIPTEQVLHELADEMRN